eukprot:3265407-Pleurochrysis_carterae.AAC.3
MRSRSPAVARTPRCSECQSSAYTRPWCACAVPHATDGARGALGARGRGAWAGRVGASVRAYKCLHVCGCGCVYVCVCARAWVCARVCVCACARVYVCVADREHDQDAFVPNCRYKSYLGKTVTAQMTKHDQFH